MACGKVIVTILAVAAACTAQRLVCPVNRQSYISNSRELLPLENLQSTSQESAFPVENFINIQDDDDPWCSSISSETFVGQYVEMTFSEPIVIASLMSGGFLSSYVNNFTVQYSLSESGEDFQVYGALQSSQDFLVQDILTANAIFVLERQIAVRRVRFVINNRMGSQGFACWKMIVFGCTEAQAQQLTDVPGPPASTTADPPTLTSQTPTTSTIPVLCSDPQAQPDLLVIVLPVAIGAFLIVVVIVALLVCICCMRCSHGKKEEYNVKDKIKNERARELENGTTTPSSVSFHYDNPRFLCYDVPRTSMRSRQNSQASLSTVGSHAEVRNPAYATKKSALQGYSESPYHVPPPEEGNDYEDIPGSPSELDKRTFSNTHSNTNGSVPVPAAVNPGTPVVHPGPPVLTNPPKMDRQQPDLARSPSNVEQQYSQVHKMRSKMKDEMEREDDATLPVINGYYVSTDEASLALANEIDRLANDLENSRAIARQW